LGAVPKREKMPYKNRASIGISRELMDKVIKYKEHWDYTWEQFIIKTLKAKIKLNAQEAKEES